MGEWVTLESFVSPRSCRSTCTAVVFIGHVRRRWQRRSQALASGCCVLCGGWKTLILWCCWCTRGDIQTIVRKELSCRKSSMASRPRLSGDSGAPPSTCRRTCRHGRPDRNVPGFCSKSPARGALPGTYLLGTRLSSPVGPPCALRLPLMEVSFSDGARPSLTIWFRSSWRVRDARCCRRSW